MDIPEEIFQIDINQLIGKLHLAGQQQIPNTVVINTGIVNPTASPDPANPGNVRFTTENKTGEYQIAFARKLIYQPEVDVTTNPKYIEAEKSKEKFKKDSDNSSITDKNKDKVDSDREKLKKMYFDIFKQYELKDYKEQLDNFEASRKSFQEAVKKENANRKDDFDKKSEKLKAEIVVDIEKYFEFFAGKESTKEVKAAAEQTDFVQLDATGDLTDPTKFEYRKFVKDFAFNLDEIEKSVSEQSAENSKTIKKEVAATVAIIVNFEVNSK